MLRLEHLYRTLLCNFKCALDRSRKLNDAKTIDFGWIFFEPREGIAQRLRPHKWGRCEQQANVIGLAVIFTQPIDGMIEGRPNAHMGVGQFGWAKEWHFSAIFSSHFGNLRGISGHDNAIETLTFQSGCDGISDDGLRTKQLNVLLWNSLASPPRRDDANSDDGTS